MNDVKGKSILKSKNKTQASTREVGVLTVKVIFFYGSIVVNLYKSIL